MGTTSFSSNALANAKAESRICSRLKQELQLQLFGAESCICNCSEQKAAAAPF